MFNLMSVNHIHLRLELYVRRCCHLSQVVCEKFQNLLPKLGPAVVGKVRWVDEKAAAGITPALYVNGKLWNYGDFEVPRLLLKLHLEMENMSNWTNSIEGG